MLILSIKVSILLFGVLIQTSDVAPTSLVLAFLFAITITSLNQYYNNKEISKWLVAPYFLLSIIFPIMLSFLPILFFDLALHYQIKHIAPLLLIFIFNFAGNDFKSAALLILVSIVSLILSHLFSKAQQLDSMSKKIRDDNALQKLELIAKNQELLSRQNDEIHLTKLKERNRIARDIHDNLGHSLSRALLQTGALQAINQDKHLVEVIEALQATLTDSMNSIRNSIHDLKDDSIDLKVATLKILEESVWETALNYDISEGISNQVKNCFLVVLKEALTNVGKHSNATKIEVSAVEHPAMYQFLITDNGTNTPKKTDRGIGLQNIKERVEELDGYCRITYKKGFRIFITLPKKGEQVSYENNYY